MKKGDQLLDIRMRPFLMVFEVINPEPTYGITGSNIALRVIHGRNKGKVVGLSPSYITNNMWTPQEKEKIIPNMFIEFEKA